jgi:hypothetical protein
MRKSFKFPRAMQQETNENIWVLASNGRLDDLSVCLSNLCAEIWLHVCPDQSRDDSLSIHPAVRLRLSALSVNISSLFINIYVHILMSVYAVCLYKSIYLYGVSVYALSLSISLSAHIFFIYKYICTYTYVCLRCLSL